VSVPTGTSVVDLLGAKMNGSRLNVTDSPVFVTGPLSGLAGADLALATAPLADAAAGFSDQQGYQGWNYGVFLGTSTTFEPLPTVRTTDWKQEWTGPYAAISITDVDQHPSSTGSENVSAVRRWVSSYDGTARISGRFRLAALQGDGVRIRVLVDGQVVHSATLSTTTSISSTFDFQRAVRAGSTIDFAVDPGPAGNIDFDATLLTADIASLP
jgi:hypothetical protein